MTVLTAPKITTNRQHARDFLSDLPSDLSQAEIEILFEDRTIATPSFVDEVVHELLLVRHAARLVVRNLSDAMNLVASAAAEDFNVSERLTLA